MSEVFAEAGLANAKKMRERNAAAKEALEQTTPTRSKAPSPALKPSPQSATAEAIASFDSIMLTINISKLRSQQTLALRAHTMLCIEICACHAVMYDERTCMYVEERKYIYHGIKTP